MGPIVPGTCSLPMVNSDGAVVPLPLGSDDHACDTSGLGGDQSLFAIGSDRWMGGERQFLTVLTYLGPGNLQSATIDNIATATVASNVFPLPMGPSDTPMLPIAGVECRRHLSASRQSMIDVALEILRRVDPTGRWERFERDIVGAAANMALSIQAAEQRSCLQAAANAASKFGSDRTSDFDSGSATPPDFVSSEPSDEKWTDESVDDASAADQASTAQRGAVLLAQHAAAADRVRQRRATVARRKKKTVNSKEASALKEAAVVNKRASRRRPDHYAGSLHGLFHGSAEQVADTVQLDRQVRFHDGPPSSGGKRVDIAKTTTADFRVPKCGVCMHTKAVGPSRSKSIANNASAGYERA